MALNKLNKTKIICIKHSSIFHHIFANRLIFNRTIYQAYKNIKYVISLIPLENDYLFKRWGINSIFIDNPTTFEYDSIIPSDLSNKNIITLGRIKDLSKRFELGIKAMVSIIKEIPYCKYNIISEYDRNIQQLIKDLNLENNIKIKGFKKDIKPYLKNSSLHIFPSSVDAYPMVLSETKIFGIPTILCGLDYLALSKGGTVMIYDDNPETIAKEAIKILKDDEYRKKLGKEARESMKKYNNKFTVKKWVKLLFSVYNGIDEVSYNKLFVKYDKRMTEKEADIILNNQLILLKKRKPQFSNLTLEQLKNYSFI